MNRSSRGAPPGELGFGAWILFWAELAALGLLAVLGASFASKDAEPGDYLFGLILALAAAGLAFLRVGSRFDPASGGGGRYPLVDDMPSLWAVIVLFVALGLAGLFAAAAAGQGLLHDTGIALFLASALGVFLSLKNVFDKLDARR